MPTYMVRFSYSPEAWAALVKKPEDRTPAVEALVKQAGGRLTALYYHMGDYDGTVIAELPDDAAANAVVMAAVASHTLRATSTIRLYTTKEVQDALGKAGKIAFQAAGSK